MTKISDFNYRRKMCETCAFRKRSAEMLLPEKREELLAGLMHDAVFLCHETMHNKTPEESKWLSSFDIGKNKSGEACAPTAHQICAGFAAMFFPDRGIDASDVDISGHAFEETIRRDRSKERACPTHDQEDDELQP